MPTPDKPSLDYSYTAFQQAQGNNSFPGTQLDNDLLNLKSAIDETIDFTSGVVRPDGKLNTGVVVKSSLAPDVLLGLASPRPWTTATAYVVDDTATINNGLYICTLAHTSGTFATDLAAGQWALLIEFTVPSSIPDGAVTTAKIAAGAVTAAKIPDGELTGAKIADASISLAKLAEQPTAAPVGAMMPFAGPFAPAKWLFAYGQTLSRVTYSALFSAITATVVGAVTSGSSTITGLAVDLRGLGLEGSVVEGPGIPSGATLASVTATTITVSANATASNGSAALRVFPHGNGDGSTTFTLPDRRGVPSAGRDNMGGVAAARLTSPVNGSRLGALGGAQSVTLSEAQLPVITPSGSVSVTINGITVVTAVGSTSVDPVGVGTAAKDPVVSNLPLSVNSAGFSGNSFGGGGAHNNVQPTAVDNIIIYTGVI